MPTAAAADAAAAVLYFYIGRGFMFGRCCRSGMSSHSQEEEEQEEKCWRGNGCTGDRRRHTRAARTQEGTSAEGLMHEGDARQTWHAELFEIFLLR